MLAEALVLFACLNNTGCTETSDQYFAQNPEVKHVLEQKAGQAREIIGPKIVDNLGPLLVFAAGGQGTVNLTHHFSLQFSQTSGTISFRLNL